MLINEIICFALITIVFLFFKIAFGWKILIAIAIGIICGIAGTFFDNNNRGDDNNVDETDQIH